MSKKVIFGVGAGVLLICSIIIVSACGRRNCHSSMAVRFAEKGVSRIESELNLTDVQKKQFKEIRVRAKADIIAHIEDKSRFLDQIDDKLVGTPDANEISNFITARMRKHHAEMEEKQRYFIEFYNILNDDQKRILVTKVKEHIERKQGCLTELVEALNEADI